MNKRGKIIPNGVSLEKHESDTVVIFTELGHTVEYIKPTNIPKIKNPDIMIDGKIWEMKSPDGKSDRTVERIFKKGAKQSVNLILDLRRIRVSEEKAIEDAKKRFEKSKRVKQMIVITKKRKLLEYKK